MKTQALKFTYDLSDHGPVRSNFEVKTAKYLEWGLDRNCPEICAMRNLDQFRHHVLKDVIADCGKQHEGTGLKRPFSRADKNKIPIMDTKYKSDTRLKNAITGFLAQAQVLGDNRIFIIGIEKTIFDKLWKKAGTQVQKEKPVANKFKETGIEQDTFPEEFKKDEYLPHGLHDIGALIDPIPEQDLAQIYLGNSRDARHVRQFILRAASVDFPVLIIGPSGTGKEKVAWEIHRHSQRRSNRFVTVNCGAISPELFESEVFGHVKGAFTGATKDKMGWWEMAHEGTLFLDEIGDLPPHHQVKILRALESRDKRNKDKNSVIGITRVGGTKDIDSDVRIIAATNRDLFTMVQTGQFREDLYYRLRGILIRTPALKNNKEDIPLLAQKIWEEITKDISDNPNRQLSKAVTDAIKTYPLAGNVRQLKNILRNVYALFGTIKIGPRHLKAVIDYETQDARPERNTQGHEEYSRYVVEWLHSFTRINETLYAIKITGDSVIRPKKKNEQIAAFLDQSLRFQLDELHVFFGQSSNLVDRKTFFIIHDLIGKMKYFANLLFSDSTRARQYWRDEVLKDIETTLSCLSKEYDRLVDIA